jgi:hypothetical protein
LEDRAPPLGFETRKIDLFVDSSWFVGQTPISDAYPCREADER